MTKESEQTDEVAETSTSILMALRDCKIDPDIAQAALGYSWYRMCKGLEFPVETFWEMCKGMGEMYEKSVNDGKTST